MSPSTRHPDRRSVAELIEELREDAEDLAQELKDIPAQETVSGEAAQALEEYGAALRQIAAGADDPKTIATEALALAKPLLLIGDAPDPMRALLKPRRT